MSASAHRSYSPEARALFEELLARLDQGDAVDVERACREAPELAPELESLWQNYRRVDGWLGTLALDHDALDSAAVEIERRAPEMDEGLRAELEQLRGGERSATRYEVEEEIARGGMGVVWRVRDRHLDRDLAMKTIRAGDAAQRAPISARVVRRFLREARVTGKLDHPGIVPVHEIGVDESGQVYFTMPLVRGTSLADVLALEREGLGGWTHMRVLEVLLKVADAVAFAHSAGVVHRDLKPANIMVGRFGETYVMDWGLARLLGESVHDDDARGAASVAQRERRSPARVETQDGAVLGTPAYMAPEQALGRHDHVGVQADVYSLGAILYHLLTGREPYAPEAESPHADSTGERSVLEALRRGAPAPIASLAPRASPELAAIAEKAMARDASARYADVRALSEDLRAYIEGRVVHAHETGAWPELKKWVRRNTALAVALAAVLSSLVLGSVAVSYVQARGKTEILRLADVERLSQLEREAADLWPAVPDRVPAMQAWLANAEPLAARRPEHERTLARMRSALSTQPGGTTPSSRWTFDHAEEQWQHDTMAALVARLASFTDEDPARGTIASVRARVQFARELAERSLVEHASDWAAAIAAIADPRACPAYAGLVLEPELGLIPLGRDPHSGLFEFAHLASGAPARRSANGTLALERETGIVLVLVPGGSFVMGSARPVAGQPSGPRTDPWAREDETPLADVSLDAFFYSKYEVSREQWERCASGVGVARTGEGEDLAGQSGASSTALLPASSASWDLATRVLARVGLELPSEAEWEYAARAGTITRWSSGSEASSLVGFANAGYGTENLRAFEDGYDGLAPIDALAPNPWGFHHVHGNVAEWTSDEYRPAETLADSGRADRRVTRGGSFRSALADLRSAARVAVPAANHTLDLGMRPVWHRKR